MKFHETLKKGSGIWYLLNISKWKPDVFCWLICGVASLFPAKATALLWCGKRLFALIANTDFKLCVGDTRIFHSCWQTHWLHVIFQTDPIKPMLLMLLIDWIKTALLTFNHSIRQGFLCLFMSSPPWWAGRSNTLSTTRWQFIIFGSTSSFIFTNHHHKS